MKRSAYVRPTRATIDLGAFAQNWRALESLLPAESKILAVVKANAYGHGSVEIALECRKLGGAGVGVADVTEAIVLREGGYSGLVLCLGAISKWALAEAVHHQMTLTGFSIQSLEDMADYAGRENAAIPIHLKIESGMHRLGLPQTEWEAAALFLSSHPQIQVEGIFTHLAESENSDRAFTEEQIATFRRAIDFFERRLGRRLIRHAANSGGILFHPAAHFDWVRPGIALYGYPPSPDPPTARFAPALTWKAPILQVKSVARGESVGYNRGFRAEKPMKIATVAAGYGDRFARQYAPVGVGFRGKRCRIAGIICMDLFMIDVSEWHDVQPGEEVTLLGPEKEGAPTARELAAARNTIPYEVLTSISARVSRLFVREEISA